MWRRIVCLLGLASAVVLAQQVPQTFKVQPLRPVVELRAEALKAQPPVEHGDFLKPDLVELIKLDPSIKLDIHYASANNFLGVPVYGEARAFLERPAAEAVVRINRRLHAQGYGLLIFDGYRPWYITRIFWDATRPQEHPYLADPAEGSRHNRGCAVDLTIYDLKTGQPVSMPSTYDDFSERAQPGYPGGTADERAHREFLRKTMEGEGFTVYPTEWWHFDYREWRKYPILNVPFSEIRAQSGASQ
jgi:D-alanyl-D-alanine dipeptidase